MDEKLKKGEKVRHRITFQEGEIYEIYPGWGDGWLLIRMEDGAFRYYEPRHVERIGPVSGAGGPFI